MCKGIGEIEALIRTKKFEESSKDFRKIYRYLKILHNFLKSNLSLKPVLKQKFLLL